MSTISKESSKDLDKFYTTENNVILTLNQTNNVINKLNDEYNLYRNKKIIYLEPSAGNGSFVKELLKQNKSIKAYDIMPEDKNKYNIEKQDFLNLNIAKNNYIVIGNPPFGNRGKLAIDFINKSTECSDIISFILPNTFLKYNTQKQINKNYKLILSEKLIDNNFMFHNKNKKVNCVHQIWINKKIDPKNKFIDKRILEKPKTSHKDFEMYLYNNTKGALKFFDQEIYKWDFAVHRQGYYNYNEYIYKEEDLNKKKQYIFFKSTNDNVLSNLKKIDYNELSTLNTTTPGFGKADIVREYIKQYGEENE